MSNKNTIILSVVGLVVLLLVALTISISIISKQKRNVVNQEQLYNAITDTLKTWKDKDNLNLAKIQIMQTDKAKDFLNIKNLTGTNLELQNLIKSQKGKIKDLNAALILKSETTITDTTRVFYPIGGDTIVFSKSILLDKIVNEWINVTFGFKMGNSYFDMNLNNVYEVTMGYEGGNLFKKGIPYATVKNLNPYTTTTDMKVYQVQIPKQKRFGIGLQVGYGGLYDIMNKKLGHGVYVGLGGTYNIINW